jgi:hypothetical protein
MRELHLDTMILFGNGCLRLPAIPAYYQKTKGIDLLIHAQFNETTCFPEVISPRLAKLARDGCLIRLLNTPWHILRERTGEEDEDPGGFGSLVNAEPGGS